MFILGCLVISPKQFSDLPVIKASGSSDKTGEGQNIQPAQAPKKQTTAKGPDNTSGGGDSTNKTTAQKPLLSSGGRILLTALGAIGSFVLSGISIWQEDNVGLPASFGKYAFTGAGLLSTILCITEMLLGSEGSEARFGGSTTSAMD